MDTKARKMKAKRRVKVDLHFFFIFQGKWKRCHRRASLFRFMGSEEMRKINL